MRSERAIRKELADQKTDQEGCSWRKPCASCFKGDVIIQVLEWVLGNQEEIEGVKPKNWEIGDN